MTIKDRIVHYLQTHPEGVDDDDLAKALNLSARQQANSRCRDLQKEGLIVRRMLRGKIHNFWIGKDVPDTKPTVVEFQVLESPRASDWFWEGNVQAKVISYLSQQGYRILSSADTTSHQTGIDIKAIKNDVELWVSVKGYPHGTIKTNPSVQAAHWFKQAVFDMIEYREIDKNVQLAIAIPDFPRYRKLSQKISWFKRVADFKYYWVDKEGVIVIE